MDDIALEAWLYGYAFKRTVTIAHARKKKRLDCGHWIDGSEPYRYQVWRFNFFPRGVIEQRTDCEFCSRRDNSY